MPYPEQTQPEPTQIRASDFAARTVAPTVIASPSAPFFLIHYPGRRNWFVHEGEWLPILQRLVIEPGTHSHHMVDKEDPGRRDVMWVDAHKRVERSGGVVLPLDIVVSAPHCYPSWDQQGWGYLRELTVKPRHGQPGIRHIDAWESPIPPRPGKRLKFRRDRAAYGRWLRALVLEGFIAPPDSWEVDEAVARALYAVERNQSRTDIPTERAATLVAAAQANLEAIEAAAVVKPPKSLGQMTAAEIVEQIASGALDEALADLLIVEQRPDVLAAVRARIQEVKRASKP